MLNFNKLLTQPESAVNQIQTIIKTINPNAPALVKLEKEFNKVPSLLDDSEAQKLAATLPKDKIPLWKHWDAFVFHWLLRNRSRVTLTRIADTLKFIIKQCGVHTIEDCNSHNELEATLHLQKIARNWQDETFNTYKKNLNSYFIWLENKDVIEKNNIRRISKCSKKVNEQYTLTEEQMSALVPHLQSRRQTRLERWRNLLFVGLMLQTAARPCELLQLEIDSIRTHTDGYKVIIKGRKQKGRPRYYRLNSEMRDIYEMYLKVRDGCKREERCLFVSSSKLTGWTDKGMRGLFKKLSKELKFKVTGYSIRRGVATLLKKKGIHETDIMHHLGHNRLSTTQSYITSSCYLTDDNIDKLGGLTGGGK